MTIEDINCGRFIIWFIERNTFFYFRRLEYIASEVKIPLIIGVERGLERSPNARRAEMGIMQPLVVACQIVFQRVGKAAVNERNNVTSAVSQINKQINKLINL